METVTENPSPQPLGQTVETPKSDAQNPVAKFFYHPAFNVVCGLVTIASLVFGIWCWRDGIRDRKLCYYVSSTRTPIVQKGKLDNFAVTYLGKPIEGDLSSAEIQIWNAGRESIRKEHLLKPITLKAGKGEQIVRIDTLPSRDVIEPSCIIAPSKDSASFEWKILEKNDGLKIQIIYVGNVSVPITLDGVIEGKKDITTVFARSNAEPPIWQRTFTVFAALSIAAIVIIFAIVRTLRNRRHNSFPYHLADESISRGIARGLISSLYSGYVFLVITIVIIQFLFTAIRMVKHTAPPFGF